MQEIIDKRIKTLNLVLNKKDRDTVKEEFIAANSDWTKASASLKDKLGEETFKKASFAHSLAEQPDVTSMRYVALRFSSEKLAGMVDPEDVPVTIAGTTEAEKINNFATALYSKLFAAKPSAVLQQMVQESEIPIADASVRNDVANFLGNLPKENRKYRDSWFNTKGKSARNLSDLTAEASTKISLAVTPQISVVVAKGVLELLGGSIHPRAEPAFY